MYITFVSSLENAGSDLYYITTMYKMCVIISKQKKNKRDYKRGIFILYCKKGKTAILHKLSFDCFIDNRELSWFNGSLSNKKNLEAHIIIRAVKVFYNQVAITQVILATVHVYAQ